MMDVRFGRMEDAASLAKAIENVENSGFMLFNPGERQLTEESAKKVIEVLSKEPNAIIVAVENEVVLGYIFVKGEQVTRVRHRASVAVVGVCDFARKRGIAQAMFEKVHQYAQEKGLHRLQISVIANNVAAVSLYEKMGYVREGLYKDSLFVDGTYIDELVLAKIFN